MHKITRINNSTGEITITHASGESHTFTIPEGVDKHEHIEAQKKHHKAKMNKIEVATPVKPNIIKRLWSKVWRS